MGLPNLYYGSGMHMAAEMKADYRRVREARASWFTGKEPNATQMSAKDRQAIATSDFHPMDILTK